jgi:hypothetical protein
VAAKTPPPKGITSAQWFGVFNATAASGGAGTYFNATSPGQFITYTLPVAKAGTYHVQVGIQTKPNKGAFQLAINGVSQGGVQDEYNASVGYAVRDLGTVYLNSGNQAFKFTVAGKNASSSGYTLAFDYIELAPAGGGSHGQNLTTQSGDFANSLAVFAVREPRDQGPICTIGSAGKMLDYVTGRFNAFGMAK